MTFLFDFWIYWASQVAQVVKNLPSNARDAGDPDSSPGLGRSPGGGNDHTFQYTSLEKPMDRGAWWAAVHGLVELDMTLQLNIREFIFQVFCLNLQTWGFYIYLLLFTTDLECSRNILWVILRLETYFKAQYMDCLILISCGLGRSMHSAEGYCFLYVSARWICWYCCSNHLYSQYFFVYLPY